MESPRSGQAEGEGGHGEGIRAAETPLPSRSDLFVRVQVMSWGVMRLSGASGKGRCASLADSEIPVAPDIAEDHVIGVPRDCFIVMKTGRVIIYYV